VATPPRSLFARTEPVGANANCDRLRRFSARDDGTLLRVPALTFAFSRTGIGAICELRHDESERFAVPSITNS
jgi:hypothetical protein